MADIVFYTAIQASCARVFMGHCSSWSATACPECAVQIDQIAHAERDPLVIDRTPVRICHVHADVCQQRDAQIGAKWCGAAALRHDGGNLSPSRWLRI